MRYGIVQGRLVISENGELQCFPQKRWKDEFRIAKNAGLDFIEILAERQYNKYNPIWNDIGRKEIIQLCDHNELMLATTCYDFIIDHNIFEDDCVLEQTLGFLEISKSLSCRAVVLPFLEKSDMCNAAQHKKKETLLKITDRAEKLALKIFVESMANAITLKQDLEDIGSSNIKCVFDTGNRAVLSSSLREEIFTLGDLIGHVHIKDKNRNSENVLLGRGLVDFLEIYEALKHINYDGDFVFETTRGSDPEQTARFNVKFCEFFKNQIA